MGDSRLTHLLVNTSNTPEPPTDIVERLHRIHPSLGLRFGDGISGIGWKLTWEWPAHDPRWARVLVQDIPPEAAHDVIGYLPMGCTADDAPGYVETHLKHYPREEVSRLRSEMHRWNSHEIVGNQIGQIVSDTMDGIARDQRAPKGQVVIVPNGRVKSRRKVG